MVILLLKMFSIMRASNLGSSATDGMMTAETVTIWYTYKAFCKVRSDEHSDVCGAAYGLFLVPCVDMQRICLIVVL